ncbi:hypothetical protein HYW74_04305 [Candidatus Pacearchaeota archaeon]|nr:hypothetical protein [Candidatus Pacearchaeota archaeon]
MKLRVKKLHEKGILKMESYGDIKEILINEDLLHPEKEAISVCFRGANSSGILDLTPKEIEKIYNSIKSKKKLIKSVKIIE